MESKERHGHSSTGKTPVDPSEFVAAVREMLADTDQGSLKAGDVADRLAAEFGIGLDVDDAESGSGRKDITGPLLSRILYHARLFPHPRFGDVEWVTEARHDRILDQDPDLIMRYSPTNAKQRAEQERNAPIEPLLPDRGE